MKKIRIKATGEMVTEVEHKKLQATPNSEPDAKPALIATPDPKETGELVALKINMDTVKQLAEDIILDTVKIGQKYLKLCKYIREQKMERKDATAALLSAGFAKSRASEIVTVATAAEETFSAFACKKIGFKGALELVREGRAIEIMAIVERVPIKMIESAIDRQEQESLKPKPTVSADDGKTGKGSADEVAEESSPVIKNDTQLAQTQIEVFAKKILELAPHAGLTPMGVYFESPTGFIVSVNMPALPKKD